MRTNRPTHLFYGHYTGQPAFSALTLLVGRQKGHPVNRVNSRNAGHDDSTINIVVVIIIICLQCSDTVDWVAGRASSQ